MNERDKPTGRRRALLFAAKAAVLGLVVWFVAWAFHDSLRSFSASRLRPNAALVVASGCVYCLALLPMAWFWRRTLMALDQPCQWGDVLRAYFLGHLGKYVPGKALVVILRTGAIRASGGAAAPIAASVFVETLTMMAVGAAIASLLLLTLGEDSTRQPWLAPLAVGLAIVAAAPTLPPVMRRIITKLVRRDGVAPDTARLTWPLLGAGWLAALVTWGGLALSLALAVRSLDSETPLAIDQSGHYLLAASLPVVVGFLSLIPGGLVVRDGLMLALLSRTPGIDEPTAIAATVLLRMIWVVSEAFACVMLKLAQQRRPERGFLER